MRRLLLLLALAAVMAGWAQDPGVIPMKCTVLPLPTDRPQGMTSSITNSGLITGCFFTDHRDRWADSQACYWKNGIFNRLPNPTSLATVAIGASPNAILVEAYRDAGIPDSAYLCRGDKVTFLTDPSFSAFAIDAKAINNRNQVVGGYQTADGHQHAFLWQNGKFLDLGTLGGEESCAYGINDRGQVVGGSTLITGERRAFLWSGKTMTDLGTLEGGDSCATAINNRGVIVGSAGQWDDDHRDYYSCSCVWVDGVITGLGKLGGLSSTCTAINNHNVIVGSSDSGEQSDFCCLYNTELLIQYQIVPGELNVGPYSRGTGINDRGQIVGHTADCSVFTEVAAPLLWEPM